MSRSTIRSREMLLEEAQQAPEEILEEVLDFLRFLKARKEEKPQRTDLRQTASVEDRDTLEADEAWLDSPPTV